MVKLTSRKGPADRENSRYYGKITGAPNLARTAVVGAGLLCALLASCAAPPGYQQGGTEAPEWDCTPLDPLRGQLPAKPCFRATLSQHNLVTVEWRVRNSRGLVYLADALGPNYIDPGYQAAECADGFEGGCRYRQRVNSGGFHRWQLGVTAPSGEQLFATTELTVPAPFPPRLTGGGALDPLAPQPVVVSWEADPRNAPHNATLRSAWIAVQDPETGRWPVGELWPRSGDRAHYTVLPSMLDDAGELNFVARDCRTVANTRIRLCSANSWAGLYSTGDHFLADNPLYIDGDKELQLTFTTRAGQERELDSASLLPGGPVRTTAASISLAAPNLTAGEHELTVRSCTGERCAAPHTLRIIVDSGVSWETNRDYEEDFYPAVAHNLFGEGIPLDITWGANSGLWLTREFTNSLTHVDATGKLHVYEVPLGRRAQFASANPQRVKPFAINLGDQGRVATSISGLSEKVIEAHGKLWFTQGGDRHKGAVQGGVNYSRIVSFDPAAQDLAVTAQDDRFCVYAMPSAPDAADGDNHVLSIAAVGQRIWVSEMRGLRSKRPGAISAFLPDAVHCSNDLDYSDPRALAGIMSYCSNGATAADGCIETWPIANAKPAMLEADPTDGSLWFTDAGGNYLGNFDSRREQPFKLHPLAEPSRLDWSIRADADAVYFVSFFKRTLYRFDKRLQSIQGLTIPSRATQGAKLHTIDIDHRTRRIWFTLANENPVARKPDAATIGYIDLDSWQAQVNGKAEKVRGVVYTGLQRAPYPERRPHRHQGFHGIAVEPGTGRIAIATMWRDQVTQLSPRPEFYGAD
ncbi:MAG: hypothetical protein HKN19_02670 [Halioglobus sp.]|nr:hypothetical protein [Halioglobus sp.]